MDFCKIPALFSRLNNFQSKISQDGDVNIFAEFLPDTEPAALSPLPPAHPPDWRNYRRKTSKGTYPENVSQIRVNLWFVSSYFYSRFHY